MKHIEKELKEKKNNNVKLIIVIIAILLIIVVITQIDKLTNSKRQAELTQLKSNTTAQMMGYIIKTSSGKVIVIDGGRKEDKTNLLNHINKLGGEVEAWFITHPHNDHAGAFISMINEENISIKKVYYTINEISWYEQNEPNRLKDTEEFINILQSEKIKANIQEVQLNQKIKIY